MNDQRIPRVALALGLAGLIPFLVSALVSVTAEPATSAIALKSLAAYAAVILSFLGGVRWGVLLAERGRFNTFGPAVVSVAPSILAWFALLLPTVAMLFILLGGLLLQYLVDSPFSPVKAGSYFPQWYPKLRLLLSVVATGSVAVALFALLQAL